MADSPQHVRFSALGKHTRRFANRSGKKAFALRLISPITRVLAYLCMILSVCVAVAGYWGNTPAVSWVRAAQRWSNPLGALGLLVALIAVGIWVARKVYIEVKKRKIPDFELTKATLLFLRRHHILFGWTAIVTASAHGIYYVLRYPDRQFDIVTGLVAWATLMLLGVFGVWLDKRLAERQASRSVRVYHFILAVLFLGGAFVHVMAR